MLTRGILSECRKANRYSAPFLLIFIFFLFSKLGALISFSRSEKRNDGYMIIVQDTKIDRIVGSNVGFTFTAMFSDLIYFAAIRELNVGSLLCPRREKLTFPLPSLCIISLAQRNASHLTSERITITQK